MLTAGVCEQGLGRYLRLLLTAGLCQQCLSFVFRPAHCSQMCAAKIFNSPSLGHCRFIQPAFRDVFDCHQLLGVKLRNALNLYNWTAYLEEPSRLSLIVGNQFCRFGSKDQDSMLLEGNLSQIFTVVKDGIGRRPKGHKAANLAEG